MRQMAISNNIYPISVRIITNVIKKDPEIKEKIVYEPMRPRTTCPAVILADSRKERVNGRTIILVDSIRTKKGFNQSGAPPGRRFARANIRL